MIDNSHIIVVFPGRMWPVEGGGAARTWSLIGYLRAKGYVISLLTLDHGAMNEQIALQVDNLYTSHAHPVSGTSETAARKPGFSLKQKGKRLLKKFRHPLLSLSRRTGMMPVPLMQFRRKRYLEILAGEVAYANPPTAAIATYVWSAHALDYMPPGVLRILDTIDVQYVRAERAQASGGNLDHMRCSRSEEIRELRRADLLLAIQDEERSLLRRMCPGSPVLCVRHAVDMPAYIASGSAHADNILYVGNKYDPNIQGFKQFLESVWPLVIAQRPDITLTVCGRICEIFNEPVHNVRFEGLVPDLGPYYEQAHLVVNPVSYGTGLKIKSVEALSYGRCLICSSVGIQGLGEPDTLPVVVADMGKDMAEAILDMMDNNEKRVSLERAAYAYAQAHLSPDAVYRELLESIQQHRKTMPA